MKREDDIEEFKGVCKKEGNYISILIGTPLLRLSGILGRHAERRPGSGSHDRDPRDLASNFTRNMRSLEWICRSEDTTFFSVLQPYNGSGTKALTDADSVLLKMMKEKMVKRGVSLFDFYTSYYAEVRDQMKENPEFIDFSSVFDRSNGQIFFDTVHFSDKGQEIVAQALAKLIQKREDMQ